MLPQGIDPQLIKEAIARRGGLQGGGTPLASQVANQGGGAPSPVQGQPQAPQPQPGQANVPATQSTTKAAAGADTPMFDPETRALSKALIKKLLGAV